jgi:hypothetical protein
MFFGLAVCFDYAVDCPLAYLRRFDNVGFQILFNS